MIYVFGGVAPALEGEVFVAPSATVLGDVRLGAGASVWYGSVVRGDVGRIAIGARTNIQDLSVVHVTTGSFDTHIGAEVTVGHRVILHGCTIHDRVLVGMGAVVMDGAEVGSYSIIGAGALVTPGASIPEGSLVLGSPGRVVRSLTEAERDDIEAHAERYVTLAARHWREIGGG